MTTPYYQPYWFDQDYLEHHGVKGQSWGEKNGPPYPLSRGKNGQITKTQKKKKQSFLARMKSEHQKKAKAKQRAKVREAKKKEAEKEKKETMSKEELRAKLLTSTDPKFIAQHMDLLETKEINERLSRIDAEKKVKNLVKDIDEANDKEKKKKEKTKKQVDAAMKWVDNISKMADATSKVAKAYNDVYDATQKKEKTRQQNEDRENKIKSDRQKAKEAKEAVKAKDAYNRLVSEKFQRTIDMYTSDINALADIKVDFDPTTGKLSFQTIKQQEKKKKKKK